MSSGGPPLDDAILGELLRRASRRPVTTPPGLVSRVLAAVNGARGRRFADPIMVSEVGGRLQVAERVIVALARRLAGDHVARHRWLHVRAISYDDGLQVLVTMRYGVSAETAAELLRGHLLQGLAAHLGDAVPAVHVHVIDVSDGP